MEQFDIYKVTYELRDGEYPGWSADFLNIPTEEDVLAAMEARRIYLAASYKQFAIDARENVREREALNHLMEFVSIAGIPLIDAEKRWVQEDVRLAGVLLGKISLTCHQVYEN